MTVVDPAQLLALTDPDLQRTLVSLLVITAVAAIVPLIVGLLRLRIAEVVLLLGFGVLVGPQVLGWVEINESIDTFNELGLGMLFFLAGFELEQRAVTGESGRLAITGWVTSLVLACIIVAGLWATDVVSDFLGVAIALTSTALGTLLPVIRDRGMLETKFGTLFMGAGAAGEFGPILAITLLLGSKSVGLTLVMLVIFAVVAVLLYFTPGRLATERLVEVVNRGHSTSSQTAVRWTVVLLLTLLVLSSEFGLDAVLGAFIAGVILRRYSPPSEANKLLPKIEAIGFGFFIPLFFIVSGANLDIDSIVENPWRLLLFFVLHAPRPRGPAVRPVPPRVPRHPRALAVRALRRDRTADPRRHHRHRGRQRHHAPRERGGHRRRRCPLDPRLPPPRRPHQQSSHHPPRSSRTRDHSPRLNLFASKSRPSGRLVGAGSASGRGRRLRRRPDGVLAPPTAALVRRRPSVLRRRASPSLARSMKAGSVLEHGHRLSQPPRRTARGFGGS